LDSVRQHGHRHADATGAGQHAGGGAEGRLVALFTVLGMTAGAGMVQLPLIALGVSSRESIPVCIRDASMVGGRLPRLDRTTASPQIQGYASPAGRTRN
jgi:hypothetical protein